MFIYITEKERNKAHKKALKLQTNDSWKEFRQLRNIANREISFAKKNYFKHQFEVDARSENFWNTVNKLTLYRVKPKKDVTTLKTRNMILNDNDAINDEFAKTFVVPSTVSDNNLVEEINNYKSNFDYSNSKVSDKNVRVEVEEVANAIMAVKAKKSQP